MSHAASIALEPPVVGIAKPGDEGYPGLAQEAVRAYQQRRVKSYTESKSRRITVKTINEYTERRLAADALHPIENLTQFLQGEVRFAAVSGHSEHPLPDHFGRLGQNQCAFADSSPPGWLR